MNSRHWSSGLVLFLGLGGALLGKEACGQSWHGSFNSPWFSKGSTEYGDYLRGAGALHYGYGAHLHGWGAAAAGYGQLLEGMGQYEVAHQQAQGLRMENAYREREIRCRINEDIAAAQEARRQQARDRQRREQLAQFRDRPAPTVVARGESINFLLAELGNDALLAAQLLRKLGPVELSTIQLQTRHGVSLADHHGPFDLRGHIAWPDQLRQREFTPLRQRIAADLQQLLGNLADGAAISPQEIADLQQQFTQLEQLATRQAIASGARQWQMLRDFVRGSQEKLANLATDEGQAAVDGRLAFKPLDAQDLLRHMVQHDLRLAPASRQGATLYTMLHQALAQVHRDNRND